MSGLKSRITLLNHLVSRDVENRELVSYLISVNKTIQQIDNDIEVSRVCEYSELKSRNIKQLKGLSRIELHSLFLKAITDEQGTNFLIFKN
jgi:hypothetical protein